MKILFVFNHPAPYKVQAFNEIAKELDIHVIFERTKARNRNASFYKNNIYNFSHTFLKRGEFGDEQSNTKELVNYIKEHAIEYDFIVMNGYSTISEMRAIRYMIKNNIPYILQINGGVVKKDVGFAYKIKKYFISHAWKYLSTGAEANKYLVHYGAREEDILYYPYSNLRKHEILTSVPTEKERAAIRDKYFFPEGKILISASQFIKRKNNVLLFDLAKGQNYSLILYGDGPEKNKYLKYLQKEDIRNVNIMPYLPKVELLEVLKCADAFISLSKEDIYGQTTIEALACALPVVSSDTVVSSKQIIKDGYNGYLVDLENQKEMLNIIDNVFNINKENCIESVKNLSIEDSAAAIINHLRSLK